MSEGGTADSSPQVEGNARPYRSHKVPACDFCRRRKSRCIRQNTDSPCVLCKEHKIECSQSSTGSKSQDGPLRQTAKIAKRRQAALNSQPPASDVEFHKTNGRSPFQSASDATPENDHSIAIPTSQNQMNQSRHIVGPTIARDFQVLEQYISPKEDFTVSHVRPNPYCVYSDDPRNPIVYMNVPRQRGMPSLRSGFSGFKQFETIEKIIEPKGHDLFELYFESFHPPFPILDEKAVLEAYRNDGLPHTLICEIYAVSLINWNTSTRFTHRSRPDVRYIWNLTVKALNEDFQTPSFSTVLASILDLIGRPITSITYNAVNLGRTVALAQSLGLNRNPASWNIEQRQKGLRIRTWWGLLIHDWWASLAHGTPPHINRTQQDVELPELDTLLNGCATHTSRYHTQLEGSQSFMALCRLTEILGDTLPLVYDLKVTNTDSRLKFIREIEMAMDTWEETLPPWLNYKSTDFRRKAPGALSLHISFLALKMCISRVSLQENSRSDESTEVEFREYHQAKCRKASQAVIDFVVSLRPVDMDAFWLPYSAYHFTSAATLILRCALEAEDDATARDCVASAKSLIDCLRHAKEELNWDLADICLSQCEAVVKTMSNESDLALRRKNIRSTQSKNTTRIEIPLDTNPTSSLQETNSTITSAHVSQILFASSVNENNTVGIEQDDTRLPNNPEMHMNREEETHGLDSLHSQEGQTHISWSSMFPDLWSMPYIDDYNHF